MVSRRTFLASVASSVGCLVLPRLQLVPDYDLHVLAAKWCGRPGGSGRYDLTAPYVMHDHAYATDAKAMVRFVDDTMQADGTVRIPECTVRVWEQFWHPIRWFDLPRQVATLTGDTGDCWQCHRSDVECPFCCGVGEMVVLPGDRVASCKACNGTGLYHDPKCNVCHGRYDVEFPTVARIGSQLFDLTYVSLLREIPGVRLSANLAGDSPLLWQSDLGLSGMIMPKLQP